MKNFSCATVFTCMETMRIYFLQTSVTFVYASSFINRCMLSINTLFEQSVFRDNTTIDKSFKEVKVELSCKSGIPQGYTVIYGSCEF